MGINLTTINWIMGCIESTSLLILINDCPSSFFRHFRGFRQGCPLSPFIFLLVVDGLRKLISQARGRNRIKILNVAMDITLTHLLLTNDIIIFGACMIQEEKVWSEVIDSFCSATWMQISVTKSVIITNLLE
jgi:hypothetical protein